MLFIKLTNIKLKLKSEMDILNSIKFELYISQVLTVEHGIFDK